jgi:hypothetical protein
MLQYSTDHISTATNCILKPEIPSFEDPHITAWMSLDRIPFTACAKSPRKILLHSQISHSNNQGKQANPFFVAFSQFFPFAVPFLFPAMHWNALFGNNYWELDNMGLGSMMGTLPLLSLFSSLCLRFLFSFLFPSMCMATYSLRTFIGNLMTWVWVRWRRMEGSGERAGWRCVRVYRDLKNHERRVLFRCE